MAARTESHAVKLEEEAGSRAVTWSLVFNPAGQLRAEQQRLQKWRVIGDGRSVREQIFAYATSFQHSGSAEGENTLAGPGEVVQPVETFSSSKISIRSGSQTVIADTDQESHGYRKRVCLGDPIESPSARHPLTEEAETRPVAKVMMSSPSPSSGSEFKYADGYVSGQEGSESKEAQLEEDDNVELAATDAYQFKVFKNEEGREPTSILNLDFDSKDGQAPNVRLLLMGCYSTDSGGHFMREIDSWSILPEGGRKLSLHVRDVKGSWIKLRNPAKGYEVAVHGALIIVYFLELAMNLKKTKAKTYLDLLMNKNGFSRAEIKNVLRKYYDPVVKKFVRLRVPSLRDAAIIKNMESLLKVEVKKKQSIDVVKKPLSMERSRGTTKFALAIQSSLKRKRVVESDGSESDLDDLKRKYYAPQIISQKRKRTIDSDGENGSDAEDHVPLAQRVFQPIQQSCKDKSLSKHDQADNLTGKDECRSSEKDPVSPSTNKDDNHFRFSKEGDLEYDGQQEFQDIAEIYGSQSDVLGGVLDDDDDEELGDSAFCAICDDGGDLLFCDGPCMRSFHASKKAAAGSSESKCESLGYTVEEVREMGSWKCPNCLHKQHQCFICGELGRSEGKDKQVFVCDVALCGRFYHPHCLADWKKKERFNGIMDVEAFIKQVKEGLDEFCCPAHKCRKCGAGEEEGGTDNSMKLAKCRRCPKAYHKVCLPLRISFEEYDQEPIRAWEIGDEEDPVKRLVMYCLDHEIVEQLSTPKRNHLKWPRPPDSVDKSSRLTASRPNLVKGSMLRKIRVHEEEMGCTERLPVHQSHDEKPKGSSLKEKVVNQNDLGTQASKMPDSSVGKEKSNPFVPKKGTSVVKVSSATSLTHVAQPKKRKIADPKSADVGFSDKKILINKEGQNRRVMRFMGMAAENITLEIVRSSLAQPSCYGENRKRVIIHRGELDSILNAIRKAIEKIKNGGSIEDAKRLCPRDLFMQLLKAEDMLRVHLAPFLHGMRYTSFGRHFTCVDKLKEIVERIHPYIDEGDMVVDFCCGANDFSILLNEKLISTGKTCQFKNFDIHPPRNGFCFTKGDWLANKGHGFLDGRKLIMGLNPPFGVRAALADKFIRHALSFRPKLLLLIVPPETMSGSKDYKNFNYDLVWEDKELLKGHAFYLPGSVDNNEKENMTQWNVVPPPLYLWSSREMIQKHRDIARRCQHIQHSQRDVPRVPHRTHTVGSSPIDVSKSSHNTASHVDSLRGDGMRRSPVPSPPAREVLKHKTFDNLTNSGSAGTGCDTSSSHFDPSPATSSLADGLSQSSLDGPCSGIIVGGHHASVQKTSYIGQKAGETSIDRIAYLQNLSNRNSLKPGSAGLHTAADLLYRTNISEHIKRHDIADAQHASFEGRPIQVGHAGMLFVGSCGDMPVADPLGRHLNSNMRHATDGSEQWGRREHSDLPCHHEDTSQRFEWENRERVQNVNPSSAQHIMNPKWFTDSHSDRARYCRPSLLNQYSGHVGVQQAGSPIPHPSVHFHGQNQNAGRVHHESPLPAPRQRGDMFHRGELPGIPHERRSQYGVREGTGGWLDN